MIIFRKSLVGKFLFFIVLFLFVYPFKLVGLPVSFRVLFSVFGAATLIIRLLALKKTYFSLRIINLAISAISICTISFVSTYIVNSAGDPELVNFWISPLLCLLSAYFVISFGIFTFPDLDFTLLSKYFITVVLAQALISAAMFLNPSMYLALLHIQQMDALDMTKSELTIGSRLLGLGASFMIMGVINCVALLLITILLKGGKLSIRYRLYLILTYLLIFAIGMAQSRTTLLGFLVSMAYLCISSFNFNITALIKSIKQIAGIIIISLILVAVIFLFANDFIQKNQQIINYAFELVVNYKERGKLESASTDDLENMYILPTNIKTYLIGDGKFNIVPGIAKYGYYMHVDVGFIRLLFYFGIPGLLLFAVYQYLLVKYSFTISLPDYKFIIFYFFLFVILWNMKSVMDTNILFTPFCILNIMNSRSKLNIKAKKAVLIT